VNSLHDPAKPEIGIREPESEASQKNSRAGIETRWTISNILSVSRVLLAVPIVVLILGQENGDRVVVIILMLAAVLTDFLDGLIARAMNQVTDFGKLLDPAADKICIIAAVAALVVAGDVPLWYAALVVLRDALIAVGGLMILSKKKIVLQSVWTGKLTVNFIAAYFVLATIRIGALDVVKDISMYLSMIFLFVSLGVYARIYQQQMARLV
jgi:CDP-diacylglycerol--glycerol-3-phosphate 3-phosphatidyltransferase